MSQKICSACGHLGTPARHTRGSILIEIVAWLCLIVPGLIYSLWRLSTRHDVCAACGAAELLPPDSPRGQRLLADFHPATPADQAGASPGAVSAGRVIGRAVGALMRK